MIISELIKELNTIKKEYGDIKIKGENKEWRHFYDIIGINIENKQCTKTPKFITLTT